MLIIKDRNTDPFFWSETGLRLLTKLLETFVIMMTSSGGIASLSLHFQRNGNSGSGVTPVFPINTVFLLFSFNVCHYVSGFCPLCLHNCHPCNFGIAATDDDLCLRNWFFDRIIPVWLSTLLVIGIDCVEEEWVGAVKCNVLSCNMLIEIEMYVGMNDM